MSIRSRSLALAASFLAAWLGTAGLAGADRRPGADTHAPRGLAAELREVQGPQRVEVYLLDQPVLEAAAGDRFQALVATPVPQASSLAARRSPMAITETERRGAARSEARFERAVSGLRDESREANAAQSDIVTAIEEQGGDVLGRTVLPNTIVARIPSGGLGGLAQRDDVQTITAMPPEKKHLDVSATTIGAPTWWVAGFTGGEGAGDVVDVDVGAIGDSVDPDHPAFAGLVTIDNSPNKPVDDHGTHVGGVIASNDPTYRGAAYGIDTLIGAEDAAYALGVPDGNQPGAEDPAEVLNFSAGAPASVDDQDRGEDLIIDLFGVGYAASAGNNNPPPEEPPAATVNNIGKNMLSVAASNDVDTATTSDDAILGISSRGPSPGGRKKPDLIAPGAAIIAPDLNWNSPASNPDYTPMTGTSFSAPHVTGALALLAGAGISDPKTQRAILINSARDWTGQTHWQPDVGWGALDLTKALADRGNIAESSVEGGGARFFGATAAPGAKATLAWNLRGVWDNFPSTAPTPTIYTTTDLDLHSYRADDLSEILPVDPGHGGGPDALDPNDTTEQVRAPIGATQDLIYKVKAASTIEGAAAEPFSLAAETALDPLVVPEVEPAGSVSDASGPVNCSTDVVITTTVRNESPDLRADSASVSLNLPADVLLISGSVTQPVSSGTLEPGASEPHSWTVRAVTEGTKSLTITGSGATLGETFAAVEPVSFLADCTAPDTAISSGPSGATNDPSPAFSFSAGGAASFECRIDAAPFAACSSPFQPPQVSDGDHVVEIRATDAAGNVESQPASRTLEVDTVGPESSVGSGPDGPTRDPRPRFAFSSSEAGSSLECRLDGDGFSPCSSPLQLPRLADGGHTFTVRASDQAGNVEPQPATRSFDVDTRLRGAELDGKGTQRQRAGRVKVKVRLSAAEDVLVVVEGVIRIPGKDARLDPQRVELDAANPAKLKLTPRSRPDSRRVSRALQKGKLAGAELEATFTDGVGNHVRPGLGIRLR